jgi:predicted glycosyltransferase
MQKVLFHLGHPAHFHLFKNVIKELQSNGDDVHILIKKKDVLEELLIKDELEYTNILPEGRRSTKFGLALGLLKRDLRMFQYCLKHKPSLLVGTSVAISHVGKILNIPAVNLNEDDAEVVPQYAKLSYPWADVILAPGGCSTSKWEHKTIHYNSYHELAYLHPNNFTPQKDIAQRYLNLEQKNFILRFSGLDAHHDSNVNGINNKTAEEIIQILLPHGNVIITSERKLNPDLDKFRSNVNPHHMHDVLAYSDLLVSDSQTMSAEAGVLGTYFIRYNDFVGKINYLEELEKKYKLGTGIPAPNVDILLETVNKYVQRSSNEDISKRRENLLQEKIDLSSFLIWFIQNFPESKYKMEENVDLQYKFH